MRVPEDKLTWLQVVVGGVEGQYIENPSWLQSQKQDCVEVGECGGCRRKDWY